MSGSASTEIEEIRRSLRNIESMLRYILERNIEEDDASPDEIEAIEMDDELISLDKLRKSLKKNV